MISPLILLAGGRSQRMGTPKGLLEVNGVTLLEHQIEKFYSFGGKQVIVVLGHIQDDYQNLLEIIGEKFSDFEIRIILNPNPDRGQFSSLQEAVKNFSNLFDGIFILPIDTPLSEINIFEMLISNVSDEIDVVIPSYNDKGGHPIWISYDIAQQVIVASEDYRLDYLIKKIPPERVKRIDVLKPSITLNLNTPTDYSNFKL